MKTHIVEATQKGERFNWGKFMLGQLDAEWRHPSHLPGNPSIGRPLLPQLGKNRRSILVFDLQTEEGAMFTPGHMIYQLNDKHKIWVCPMFEPFLIWLDTQDLADIATLPHAVELDTTDGAVYGYRRGEPAAR